jgi:hypothetical protein
MHDGHGMMMYDIKITNGGSEYIVSSFNINT